MLSKTWGGEDPGGDEMNTDYPMDYNLLDLSELQAIKEAREKIGFAKAGIVTDKRILRASRRALRRVLKVRKERSKSDE